MKTLSSLFCCLSVAILFASCASRENVELGGAAGWIAGGAQINAEPDPMAPDTAIIEFEEEGGPIEMKIITDKRKYEQMKKKGRPLVTPGERHDTELIEPGRDYRIKRLFR